MAFLGLWQAKIKLQVCIDCGSFKVQVISKVIDWIAKLASPAFQEQLGRMTVVVQTMVLYTSHLTRQQ